MKQNYWNSFLTFHYLSQFLQVVVYFTIVSDCFHWKNNLWLDLGKPIQHTLKRFKNVDVSTLASLLTWVVIQVTPDHRITNRGWVHQCLQQHSCVAWQFKQFEREHTKQQSRKNELRRGTACQDDPYFSLPLLLLTLTTRWQILWIVLTANQSVETSSQLGWNKLMWHWSIKTKLSDQMWCLLDGCKGGIEGSVNDNCRLCCCLLKISFENLNILMQNLFQGFKA